MITVYSKNNCPNCVKTKALLKEYGIQWEEKLVDENTEYRNFLIEEGHRAVPQLYVGNEYLGDYSDIFKMSVDTIIEKVEELGNKT